MARSKRVSWAVIGAGHGGQALAAYLALKGEKVSLHNRSAGPVEAIRRQGGIRLRGAVTGFARLEVVSSDMEEALDGVRVILVTVPASAHRDLARAMAPYLQAGQIIILNPGRTLGAVEFQHVLRENGAPPGLTVAETETFIFASRRVEPGVSRINRVKRKVHLAALPAYRTASVLRQVRHVLPQFVAAANVLETGLSNIGAIFHPAPTLLNAGWIESASQFDYYHQGITRGVARALERVDEERLAIAESYRVRAVPARRWLAAVYGTRADDLYTAIQRTKAYGGLKSPASLEHRYVFEDVPMSLVPLADLARAAGRSAPVMESLITIACALTGVDWVKKGRTLASVGLGGMGVEEIIDFVKVGLRKVPHTQTRTTSSWNGETVASDAEAFMGPDAP
ncbi:MAG TPA: NADP transhydrogenase subunit alpha [Clostridiales bacterium]|nr:NADP transhydrogenase subunit alpha [Clostridiales bacterium]